jgi:PAS domain S-box-containing protein
LPYAIGRDNLVSLTGSALSRPDEAAVQARIFQALQELALAAGAVVDPSELAALAVEHARGLVGGWSATLVWFEPGGAVRVLADNHPTVFPTIDLEPGRGMSGQILLTGSLTVVDDYHAWEHAFDWAVEGGVRSLVGVPLKVRDRALGCLIVRSAEPGFFVPEVCERLTLLASVVAPALQAASLAAEREKQAGIFRALHELAVAASGVLEPRELARIAVERCRELLQVDGTVLFNLDRQSGSLQPLHESTSEVVDRQVKPGEGAIGLAFSQRKPYAVDDYATWEHRMSGPAARGLAAGLSHPLIAGDKAIGVIGVWCRTKRSWTENDIQILSLVAAQIGPALQRATAAMEREIQTQTIRALNEVAVAAAGVLEPAELARIATERARDLAKSTGASLTWYDDQEDGLRLLAETEIEFDPTEIVPVADAGAHGFVFETGKPMAVADYPNWSRRVPSETSRITSALVVPLQVRQRRIGTLGVSYREHHHFMAEDIQMLSLLAAEVAPSLEAARLHEDLVASTRSTRAIFDTAPVGIARLDVDLHILGLNRRAEELTGLVGSELVGRPVVLNLIGADDLADEVRRLVAGERQQLRFERVIRRPMGGSFLADLTLTVVRNPAGQAEFLYAMFDDITERKHSEEALRESEGRKSAIVESSLNCIMAADDRGRIIEYNPAAERIFGFRREDVIGKGLWDTIIPPRLRRAQQRGLEAMGIGDGSRFETICIRADGTEFPVELAVAAFQQGGKAMFSTSIRDLTERVHAETMRQESEAKSRFVAAMSHELRTPLNSILGFSQLLASANTGDLNDRQQRYVGHIETSGRHLLALINDVLDLSKVEAGQMEVELEPIELEPLLEEAISQLRPLADAKTLELILDPAPGIWIRADRRRFIQVMLNLLSNAIKFTESGGCVRVTSVRAGRTAEISVIDSGIGIPAEEQQRIFEEFTQVDRQASQNTEGTGLGLALSRRLLQLMRGSIDVVSEEGKGSTFRVAVQRIRPAEVADARPLLLVVDGTTGESALVTQLASGSYRVLASQTVREAAQIARRRRLAGIVIGESTLLSDEEWLRNVLHDNPKTHTLPILSAAVALQPGVLIP